MFDLRTFLALCLMIIEISLDLFLSNWILSLLLTNYSQSFLVSVKFFFRFWERLYIGKQDMNPEHIKEKSVSLLVVYRRLIARTNVLLQWKSTKNVFKQRIFIFRIQEIINLGAIDVNHWMVQCEHQIAFNIWSRYLVNILKISKYFCSQQIFTGPLVIQLSEKTDIKPKPN